MKYIIPDSQDESIPGDEESEDEIHSPPEIKKPRLLDHRHHINHNDQHPNIKNDSSQEIGPSQPQLQLPNVEMALFRNNYRHALSLLIEDEYFPENFHLDSIDVTDADGRNLKEFVEERLSLHELIMKDNVDEVKKVMQVGTTKLYLNLENQSALWVAIRYRSFYAYSYLLSVNAEFQDDEREIMYSLTYEEIVGLEDIIRQNLWSDEKKHLEILLASSSFNPNQDFRKIVKNYYEKLDKIPEISIILKVLQYASCLQIVFDFNNSDITDVSPTDLNVDNDSDHDSDYDTPIIRKQPCGVTKCIKGEIVIDASEDRGENRILGTIAHEFTHMAMHIVFKNYCNPYDDSDEEEKQRLDQIIRNVENLDNVPFTPSEILHEIDPEESEKRPSELIARVPQILVEEEQGREWMEENVKDLYEFHNRVILKCREYIKNENNNNLKSNVKLFNETQGEIGNLVKLNVFFKNLDQHNFLTMNDKNTLIIKSESTTLSLIRTLQKLYGRGFVSHSGSYLVVKFDKLLKNYSKILDLANELVVKTLIVEFQSSDITDSDIKNVIVLTKKILETRPSLKFVFIVPKTKFISCKSFKVIEESDLDFSINDLEDECIDRISNKIILFQGKGTSLKRVVNAEDLKLICGKTMEIFCTDENVEIGGRVSGTSSLEGAYNDVVDEINIMVFGFRAMYWNFSDIFIINGLREEEKHEQLGRILGWMNVSKRLCDEYKLKAFENKMILFTDDELLNNDFKEFCHLNPDKKIYLLDLAYEETKFIIKHYYNPTFYMERRFKSKVLKCPTKGCPLDPLKVSSFSNEHFIISNSKDTNGSLSNFHFLPQAEAKKKFEHESKDKKTTVHYFELEHNTKNDYVWKGSSGSVKRLRKHMKNSRTHDEVHLIKEIESKKVVLIADEPGMGKSTSITKLYERKMYYLAPSISEQNWLIRINLRDHLDAIKTIQVNNLNDENLIRFLCEIDRNLKTEPNQFFLKLAISFGSFLKPLLIVFDGFDEIPQENDRDKIKVLLKHLKSHRNCKIWVTTRLDFKEELENELSTFAVEFEPIVNDNSKKKFIKNYFEHRLDLILISARLNKARENTRLNAYVDLLTAKLKNIFKKGSEKFIRTPLQLNLVLDNSADSFKNYVNYLEKYPDFSFLGRDLLHIYKGFLDMKYEVYLKKKNTQDELLKETIKNSLDDYYKKLAESMLFCEEVPKDLMKYKRLLSDTGITKCEGQNIEFIHFTFREYFTSQVIIEHLENKRLRKLDIDSVQILLKDIFLDPGHQSLRTFINLHMERLKLEQLPLDNLVKISEGIALLWGRNPSLKCGKGTVIHVAIEEKNKEILKFLLSCCKKTFANIDFYNLFTILNSRSHTILHAAVFCNDSDFFNFVFSEFRLLGLDSVIKELITYGGDKKSYVTKLARIKHSNIFDAIKSEFERIGLDLF